MAKGSCLDDALRRRRKDASLAGFRVQSETCLRPAFREQITSWIELFHKSVVHNNGAAAQGILRWFPQLRVIAKNNDIGPSESLCRPQKWNQKGC
jgi:hypothetical protein